MTERDKKIIEDSEKAGIPIFVFTAKDINSISPLYSYFGKCMVDCKKEHLMGILDRMKEFLNWQAENPHRTKLPD